MAVGAACMRTAPVESENCTVASSVQGVGVAIKGDGVDEFLRALPVNPLPVNWMKATSLAE